MEINSQNHEVFQSDEILNELLTAINSL